MYDIIVVGGGPAGLTAAVYCLRAGKSVLVIEKNGFGGQIAYSPKVENIPGTKVISGAEFADHLTDQAMALGAEMELEKVIKVEKTGKSFKVYTEEENVFEGGAVILALGVKHRMLGLPAPTRVLYLDMPTELSGQMMRRREQETGTHADIHEQDAGYLRRCRENAAFVVDYCGWTRIDCANEDGVRSIEDIHAEVMEKLSDLLVP